MSGTPPWLVDEPTLAAGFAKIASQWSAVREILEEPDLYGRREPGVSGWSCGEHAGHIALVTLWIANGIEKNLADPGRHTDGEWTAVAGPILQGGSFPRGVAKSPPPVDTAGRPREVFLPVLPESIAAWERVAARAGELPGCPARFEHFALGYLTSEEWVRFCAIHTAHHLAVVRDIRSAGA